MVASRFPYVLFDWGGTLMSEDGPAEIAMAYWDEVKAIAGAATTLATLAPRHSLCLATNAVVSGREQIELALERASLRRYISQIFCAAEIGARKESPAF
ncbi:MAG TPA: hypothetical protein VEZ11_18810 [Thermoanaerobaculia bacterium]|nr:hypothetical protein [Thermoanaerobaculia bacterium]